MKRTTKPAEDESAAERPAGMIYPTDAEPPQPRYVPLEWDASGGAEDDSDLDIHFELDHRQQVNPFW